MAFNYVGSINGAQRNLYAIVADDSEAIAVGGVVKSYTNGYAQVGVAATPILGITHAITTKGTLPPIKGESTAGSANTSDTATVTTAADNTTTEKYWVLVDTSRNSQYSVTVSGTIGTTATSGRPGCRIDVDSANTTYTQVLETTATRTVGTPANFYSWGVDPNDSARLIVSISLSELDSVDE